jgi:D-amino-acid dehydrogenase
MKSEVVIIGGGAIGLCSAYYLHRAGAAVTVIDRGEVGHGCSLHNAGYVCPSHFIPLASPGIISQGLRWMLNPLSPFYIKPRLDPDFISWAWKFRNSCTREHVHRSAPLLRDLGVESLRLYTELAHLDGVDFEFTRRGILNLFRTERGRRVFTEERDHANQLGIAARIIEREEIQTLEPDVEIRATGALFFPDDTHITPAKFVQGLAGHLDRQGVRFIRNTDVTGLRCAGNRIREVITGTGTVAGDEFVLAAGSWSPLLARQLGMRLLVQAGKGYSITITRPDRKPAIPMILTEARVALTSMGNTFRAAGTMEIAGLDLSITRRRVDAILNALGAYIGGFVPEDFQAGEVWAGLRPVTPDGMPYIGRFRTYRNLIAATGHAMIGISLAPVTGSIVAALATGNRPGFNLSLLSPDRFG